MSTFKQILRILSKMSLREIANIFDQVLSKMDMVLTPKQKIEMLTKGDYVVMHSEPLADIYENDINLLRSQYPVIYFNIFEAPFLDDPDGLDRIGMSAEDRYEEDISFLYNEHKLTYYIDIFVRPLLDHPSYMFQVPSIILLKLNYLEDLKAKGFSDAVGIVSSPDFTNSLTDSYMQTLRESLELKKQEVALIKASLALEAL